MESKKQTTKPPTKKSWANVVGGVTSDVSKPMLEPKTPAPKQTEKPHAATSWANVAKGGQANSKDSSKPAARDDKAVSTKATNAQPPISSTSVAKAAPSPSSANIPSPSGSSTLKARSSCGEHSCRPRLALPKTSTLLNQKAEALEQREKALEIREQRVAHQEAVLNTLLAKLNQTIELARSTLESCAPEQGDAKGELDSLVKTEEDLTKASSIEACPPAASKPGPELNWSAPESPKSTPSSLTDTIQKLEDVSTHLHMDLWNDPVGADICIVARNVHGQQGSLMLHGEVVAPKCGWLREQIPWSSSETPGPKSSTSTEAVRGKVEMRSFDLNVELALANACFYFAYTGGKASTKELPVPGMPTGQQILDQCRPSLACPINLSSLDICLHMYGAAVQLQMPELCCWILEQVEAMASNVAEAACMQRLGNLWTDMIPIRRIMERALTFIHAQDCQDRWRPMRMAFAGLYDAVSLRVGPYLTFSSGPEMSVLVLRLQQDVIEYRQNQGSCLPQSGTLVPFIDEMETTLTRRSDLWLWYGSALYQETYLQGRSHAGSTSGSARTTIRTTSGSVAERDEDTESEYDTVIHL